MLVFSKWGIMKWILAAIRFIFLPLKILSLIVYGPGTPRVAGYSWYNRAEYEKMARSAADKEMLRSYDEWRENADETISSMRNHGLFVVKVKIKSAELNRWLRENNLKNLNENREIFIGTKLKQFLDDPTI